jgi:mxaA protein
MKLKKSPHILCVLLMLLSTISLQVSAAETKPVMPVQNVSVQSTMQEIGYQVGDIARQTIVIRTPKGYELDEASLPNIGKSAVSIELRDAQWSAQNTGNETVHTLILDWQIFRVMQETRNYPLKKLDLQFILADKKLAVHVKPGQMLVASVLPSAMKKLTAEMNAEQLKPKADVLPQARNTQALIMALIMALIGLLVSSLYFAWRFDWLPARLTALFSAPLPFRRAYRDIQALQKTGDTSTQLSHAMLALRRACDATAGTTLSAERVALLFNGNNQFTAKRTDIERFYMVSEHTFFAGDASDLSIEQLKQLSRQLMMLEAK